MAQYKTPGVYVEEKSMLPPSVAGVATAVPAFIGYTEKQSSNAIQPITSLLEYETLFGGAKQLTYDKGEGTIKGHEYTMYDSMRLFYDNGGGFCYVVSTGTYEADVDEAAYTRAIDKLKEQADVTLLVFPDSATLLKNDNLKNVQVQALAHCAKLGGRFAILDIKRLSPEKDETPTALLTREIKTFRENVADNLCFGAAYYPYLKTSYAKDIQFENVIAAMTEPADPEAKAIWDRAQAILSASASKTYAKGAKAGAEAEAKTDTEAQKALKIKAIIPQIEGYAEKLAELQDQASVIPPSGAIAGIYAAVDARAGVWQAPANVGIAGAKALTRNLTDDQQDGMNVDPETAKSINAIRYFRGKGILVWGSRTLDGGSNEWRYVPVRRLFSYVEQSLKLSTAWAVFQPNDATTWVKLRCQISSFLSTLWRDGALTGSTAEEAFFVEVGKGITMTQDDINNGYLKVRVGLAAVRPAEFIVLEFSHMVQE